jgi:hypothetical protein
LGSAKRKRQFMIIGGLCILAIVLITAIVLAVVLINNDDDEKDDPNKPGAKDVSLEDILLGKLQAKRFNGTWISDDEYTYFDANVTECMKKYLKGFLI